MWCTVSKVNKQLIYAVSSTDDADLLAGMGADAFVIPQPPFDLANVDWSPLKARSVIVVADRSDRTAAHARQAARFARRVTDDVQLRLPAFGDTLGDHLIGGGTLAELVRLDNPFAVSMATLFADGAPTAPVATIGLRTDSVALFYPGSVNMVFGDSGSCKTWVALAVAVETLAAGGRVAIFDLDARPVEVANRLTSLGADLVDCEAQQRYSYYGSLDAATFMAAMEYESLAGTDLVIVDNMGEVMAMMKASSKDADEFTSVWRRTVAPLADSGACVIVIDHVPKSAESAAYGAVGTHAKRRVIGGAMYRATVRTRPAPGRPGIVSLVLEKDRHGDVERHLPGDDDRKVAAVFKMNPTSPTRIACAFVPPTGSDADQFAARRNSRTTGNDLADDIERCRRMNPVPTSVPTIKRALGCGQSRAQRVRDALLCKDSDPTPRREPPDDPTLPRVE